MSRLVAGLIHRDGDAYATYQVHWTLDQVESHDRSQSTADLRSLNGGLSPQSGSGK
jgi:hypothetical protein